MEWIALALGIAWYRQHRMKKKMKKRQLQAAAAAEAAQWAALSDRERMLMLGDAQPQVQQQQLLQYQYHQQHAAIGYDGGNTPYGAPAQYQYAPVLPAPATQFYPALPQPLDEEEQRRLWWQQQANALPVAPMIEPGPDFKR